jgi:hypothetical protein
MLHCGNNNSLKKVSAYIHKSRTLGCGKNFLDWKSIASANDLDILMRDKSLLIGLNFMVTMCCFFSQDFPVSKKRYQKVF